MTYTDLNEQVKKFYPKFPGFTLNQDKTAIWVEVKGSDGKWRKVQLDLLDFFIINNQRIKDPDRAILSLAIDRIEAAVR